MRNFCMCLFNTDKPSEEQLKKTGKNQYFSFYRQAGSSSEELYFSPIDIMNIECDVQDETGRIVHRKVEPAILKYNEIMGIGPSGFTVHEIGQNIKSFQLMASNKDGLEYYLITVTQNK